jgi:hypothetical protein
VVKKWSTGDVINYLEAQHPGYFNEYDFKILQNNRINGELFLELTKEDLERWGMMGGPAIAIVKKAKAGKYCTYYYYYYYCLILGWSCDCSLG